MFITGLKTSVHWGHVCASIQLAMAKPQTIWDLPDYQCSLTSWLSLRQDCPVLFPPYPHPGESDGMEQGYNTLSDSGRREGGRTALNGSSSGGRECAAV